VNRELILTAWAIVLFFFVLFACAALEGWFDKDNDGTP
jgi:hypothetical protein